MSNLRKPQLQKHQKGGKDDFFESCMYNEYFLFEENEEEFNSFDDYYTKFIANEACSSTMKQHDKSKIISELIENKDLPQKKEINIIYNIHDQSTDKEQDSQDEKDKINKEIGLNEFIQYISLKITKDKRGKINKNALIYLYNQLEQTIGMKPLNREDKRDKKKIYMKLYKYSSCVIQCFEENPQRFLIPVILYVNYQESQKKRTIKRVIYLKKMLHIIK